MEQNLFHLIDPLQASTKDVKKKSIYIEKNIYEK
jgi:hypothetical protein